MEKKKVIIDCDPGIDDALAIFMALASEKLDVLGITTVAGNVGIDFVTRNARSLVTLAGKELPVCRGASGPFIAERRDGGHVHGADGVGGVALPEPAFPEDPRSAPEFIRQCAEQYGSDGLELITIGPLTNIASALHMYPSLAGKVQRISMMGGAAGMGNATPAAEFNIYADPHAAAAVFQSGIPIDMYGLDVTNRALITAEERAVLRKTGRPVALACSSMLESYADFYTSMGYSGMCLHDPFTVAGVIDESLVEFKSCYVDVEIQGALTRGKTVVDVFGTTGRKANTRVGMDLNREGFIRLLTELICRYE